MVETKRLHSEIQDHPQVLWPPRSAIKLIATGNDLIASLIFPDEDIRSETLRLHFWNSLSSQFLALGHIFSPWAYFNHFFFIY